MRCYFFRRGRIRSHAELPHLSGEEAVAEGKKLFAAVAKEFEGFEVWDGNRKIYRHGVTVRPRLGSEENSRTDPFVE